MGEISHIYYEGKFDCSVLKTAKNGEFRIHTLYGGSMAPVPEYLDTDQIKKWSKTVLRIAEKAIYGEDQ